MRPLLIHVATSPLLPLCHPLAMAARHLATCLAAYVLLASALPPRAAGDLLGHPFCETSGNYTQNDTYQANIQSLADTLPKNASASTDLFATASLGSIPNIVYALALCRGDTNASACESCVANAFTDAQQLCAYNKGATVFYDPCILRYDNTNFLNSNSNGNQLLILHNTQNVTVPFKVFDAAVAVFVNATADYAANSSRRFGTVVEGFQNIDSQKPKLYGLAQCTPDMSPADCRSCLGDIIQMGPRHFSGRQGGRIVGVRCGYRFEQYSFTSTPLLQLPEPAVQAPATNVTPPVAGGGEFGGLKVSFLLFLRSIRSVQALNFATRGGEKVSSLNSE
jgi:hypothetical protein